MNNILYDCFDKNEQPIGIIFARDCKDLLQKNPSVKYVRGMDAVTRRPHWHEVTETGLVAYQPKTEAYKKESDWSYFDFV